MGMNFLSEQMKNIKDYNKYLIALVIVDVLIFYFINFKGNLNIDLIMNNISLLDSVIISTVFGLITLILNYFLDSDMKAKIVFFKFKHYYPGHHIFNESELLKDDRVDKKILIDKHGKLPKTLTIRINFFIKFLKNMNLNLVFLNHTEFFYYLGI
jgi:hypothetical protein